ncbi:SRPBCC family protein [Arthrobacter sp. MDT2-16]
MMSTKVEETVVVNLPVTTVYNQWTQFEEFPHFMGGIKQITQLSDDRLEWVAEIGGIRRQWEAKVLEQVPDRKVSWAATEGATNAGSVSFEDLGGITRVNLVLEYEPEGLVEKVGDKLNVVENQAKADLQKFKEFIESESYATGAWRGSVAGTGTTSTPTAEDAAESRGDSGKAGVSGKLAAGVGVAAAAAVAGVAAAAVSKKNESDETVDAVETVDTVDTVTTTNAAPLVPENTPIVDEVDVIDVDPVPAVDGVPGTGVPSESQGFENDPLADGDPTDRRGTL